MRPDDHLSDHPDDCRDAGRYKDCTAAIPGLGWREWGPLAASTGLYMWFGPPEPSLSWAYPPSAVSLQLACGRPVPTAGLPHCSESFFAPLRVGTGGAACV